jgi:hypothetical protein
LGIAYVAVLLYYVTPESRPARRQTPWAEKSSRFVFNHRLDHTLSLTKNALQIERIEALRVSGYCLPEPAMLFGNHMWYDG